MKVLKSKHWELEINGTEKNAVLFGINIFDYVWKDTLETALINGEEIRIYSVTDNNQKYLFAAKEVSYGVWEFYTYKY